MKKRTSWGLLLVSVLLALSLFTSCGIDDLINLPDDTTQIKTTTAESADVSATITENAIDKDGSYTTKEDVGLYIHTYGRLPKNFITKAEARKLGWEGGGLEKYASGKCIGGDRFGNYEELLPEKEGRTYTECDIDTLGKTSRGAKRIVFSNDGLVYYTDDHYESFTLLYGEDT
ncbi:MAG TPA: ribonuclease [Clostridiales bacterium]|nr:ribonuclease [Clostridiales bacterium]